MSSKPLLLALAGGVLVGLGGCIVLGLFFFGPSSTSPKTAEYQSYGASYATAQAGARPTETIQPTYTPTATQTPKPTVTPEPTATARASLSPTPKPVQGTIKAEALNVRAGPGTGFPVLAQVVRGQVVRLLARNDDASWLFVATSDGRQGWVATAFVAVEGGWEDISVSSQVIPTPTKSPTPRPTATVGPQWHYHRDQAVLVVKAIRRSRIDIWRPHYGYEFVGIFVVCSSTADRGTTHCSPLDFRLMTDAGAIYEPLWLAEIEPALRGVDLAPRGRAEGWVTFEVPAGSKSFKILWQPYLFDKTIYIPVPP